MSITLEQRNKIIDLFDIGRQLKLKTDESVTDSFRGRIGSVATYSTIELPGGMWSEPVFHANFLELTPFPVRVSLKLIDSPELEAILNPPPKPETKVEDDDTAAGWGVLIGSAALAAGVGALLKRISKKSKKQSVQEEQKVKIEEESLIKV